MPLTRCTECGQSHPWSSKTRQAGPRCVYNDPDRRVDRRLREHRGLPDDCPGCLGHGTIEQRSYGNRAGDLRLVCRDCHHEYFWSVR